MDALDLGGERARLYMASVCALRFTKGDRYQRIVAHRGALCSTWLNRMLHSCCLCSGAFVRSLWEAEGRTLWIADYTII